MQPHAPGPRRPAHPLGILLGFAALALAGCAGRGAAPDAADTPRRAIPVFVSTDWLADHLDDPGLVVVHVGHGRAGYERARIPHARFLEPRDWLADRDGIPHELPDPATVQADARALGIDPGSRIVLYGDAAGVFPARAWFTLAWAGLADRTAILDGHLRRWQAEGRPTDAGPPAGPDPAPGRVTAAPDPALLATLDDVAAASARLTGPAADPTHPHAGHRGEPRDTSRVVLVDVREPRQFRGERRGYGVDRPGRIPGSVNVHWLEQIRGVRDPALKPPAELLALYRRAGVTPGDRVIVYGSTGVQASVSLAVLRHLGVDARLFDPGYAAWSASPHPVTTGPTP